MKLALWVCLISVCLNVNANAQGRMGTFLRRATLAASCAASFWDFKTTAEGAKYGATEGNGMLADGHGRPRIGLVFGVKAGLCGFAVLAQETHIFGRGHEKFTSPAWTAMNVALAARFSAVAVHNNSIIRALRQSQNQTPATPLYLAPQPGPASGAVSMAVLP